MGNFSLNLMMKTKNLAGFTLLEVLVALAILAITLSAIIKSTGSQAQTLDWLRSKTIAQWVASNHLTQLRIQKAWLETGKTEDKVEMGLKSWYWQMEVSNTSDARMRKIKLTVFEDEEKSRAVVTVIGFLAKP